MDYILEISKLQKRYNDFIMSVDEINIKSGQIVGLIGENGAGKSTLINLLLKEIARDTGDIKFFGLSIDEYESEIKEDVGVVFDECCFPEELSIKQLTNIFPYIFKKWESHKFDELIKRFKLPESKSIASFSNGMKAKLSFAVALSHKPKILLLDEATSNLDPIVRTEILMLLKEFVEQKGGTVLFSSHITNELQDVSDQIIFIHKGRILFSGMKKDLLDKYNLLLCEEFELQLINKQDIISILKKDSKYQVLMLKENAIQYIEKNYIIKNVDIDILMLAVIKGETL